MGIDFLKFKIKMPTLKSMNDIIDCHHTNDVVTKGDNYEKLQVNL